MIVFSDSSDLKIVFSYAVERCSKELFFTGIGSSGFLDIDKQIYIQYK